MFVFFIPVMVVTHSRRRVLTSVRSQAPASAGAGRGMNLDRSSAVPDLDVEGSFSVWEIVNCLSIYTLKLFDKSIYQTLIVSPSLVGGFLMGCLSPDASSQGKDLFLQGWSHSSSCNVASPDQFRLLAVSAAIAGSFAPVLKPRGKAPY